MPSACGRRATVGIVVNISANLKMPFFNHWWWVQIAIFDMLKGRGRFMMGDMDWPAGKPPWPVFLTHLGHQVSPDGPTYH